MERRPGPPGTADGRAAFDASAKTALVWDGADDPTLDLFTWSGSDWRAQGSVATGLAAVADAALTSDGSLVVVASSTGGFERFDAGSGRLIAGDPVPDETVDDVGEVALQEHSNHLYLHFLPTPGAAPLLQVIQIPIDVDPLTDALCERYDAEGC